MFKIICNTGRWETLYLSRHASAALRDYLPANPLVEGSSGSFQLQHLIVRKREGDDRIRVVILITDAIDLSLPIFDRIAMKVGRELEDIALAPDLREVGRERLALDGCCRAIDSVIASGPVKAPRAPRLLALVVVAQLIAIGVLINGYSQLGRDVVILRTDETNRKNDVDKLAKQVSDVLSKPPPLSTDVTNLATRLSALEQRSGKLASPDLSTGLGHMLIAGQHEYYETTMRVDAAAGTTELVILLWTPIFRGDFEKRSLKIDVRLDDDEKNIRPVQIDLEAKNVDQTSERENQPLRWVHIEKSLPLGKKLMETQRIYIKLKCGKESKYPAANTLFFAVTTSNKDGGE
jgi:hypothetical protein